jgi:hypothetical protein
MEVSHIWSCDWCRRIIHDLEDQNSMQEVTLTTHTTNQYPERTTKHYEGLWCLSCLNKTGLVAKSYLEVRDTPASPTVEDLLRRLIYEVAQEAIADDKTSG